MRIDSARALVPACAVIALAAVLATLSSRVSAEGAAYEYDELGRLKTATYSGSVQIRYDLDASGNRTNVSTVAGGGLRLAAGSLVVPESVGSMSISVQRTGITAGAASVIVSTSNGTASAGADYTSNSVTLNWTAGDATAKNFIVSIAQDAAIEGNETLFVSITQSSGAWISPPTASTITIVDDDTPPAGSVQFTAASTSAGESAGSIAIAVSRVGGSYGQASIICSTQNGTATAGTDYWSTAQTITWPNGDSATRTCTVPLISDTAVEGTESFTLLLANPVGVAMGNPSAANATIVDDDSSPPDPPCPPSGCP